MNAQDPRPDDQTIKLRILKALKKQKESQFQDERRVGLFQSEILVEGLDEYNPFHRQAKTNVLVALLGAGLVMQDQRGARTARFQITDRPPSRTDKRT